VPQVITCICSIPTVRSSGQSKIDEAQNRLGVRSWWLTHVREAYLRIGLYENHDSFKDAAQVSTGRSVSTAIFNVTQAGAYYDRLSSVEIILSRQDPITNMRLSRNDAPVAIIESKP
jgi:hypothetical protein